MELIDGLPENAKREVKERVLKSLKPNVFEHISMAEIDEIIERASKGVTNIDLALFIKEPSAFCDRCGECCRRQNPIIIKEKEIMVFAFYLGVELDIAKANFTKTLKDGRYSLKCNPCVFLKGNLCSIYEVRPLVCKQFPLTEGKNKNLTLAWYDYCKVPVNMVTFKTIGFIMKRILEKEKLELDKALRIWAESYIPSLKGAPQTNQIYAFMKLFKKFPFFDEKD
jgi:Fe-S-cluster containining protein